MNENAKQSMMEHREQYYATARKPIQQSQSPTCQDSMNALERIPEYSEDIYPYATFHLPDQENLSGNPSRHSGGNGSGGGGGGGGGGGVYDTRDAMSVKQVPISHHVSFFKLNCISSTVIADSM